MKKFLFIVLLCCVGLYLISKCGDDGDSDAVYNAETFDIDGALDPNDEDAFMLYGTDSLE